MSSHCFNPRFSLLVPTAVQGYLYFWIYWLGRVHRLPIKHYLIHRSKNKYGSQYATGWDSLKRWGTFQWPCIVRCENYSLPEKLSDNPLVNYMDHDPAVKVKMRLQVFIGGRMIEATWKLKSSKACFLLRTNSYVMQCPSSCRKTYVFSHLCLYWQRRWHQSPVPKWETTHEIFLLRFTWLEFCKVANLVGLSCHV